MSFYFTDPVLKGYFGDIDCQADILVNTNKLIATVEGKQCLLQDGVIYENNGVLSIVAVHMLSNEIKVTLDILKDFDKFKIVNIEMDSDYLVTKSMRYRNNKILVKVLNSNDYNYCYVRPDDSNGNIKRFDDKIYMTIFGDKVFKIPKFGNNIFNKEALFEFDINSDVRYYLNKVSHDDVVKEHRVACIDIETNGSVDVMAAPKEIISCVLHDSFTKQYHYYLFHPDLEPEVKVKENEVYVFCSNEKLFLLKLVSDLKQYDIITGWNISSFDILYIAMRLQVLTGNMQQLSPLNKVKFNLKEDKDRFEDRHFHINGLDVIDCMILCKKLFTQRLDKPERMTLDDVAKFLFKDKAKLEISSPGILWKEKKFDELLEYNKQDVYLTVKIADEMKALEDLYAYRQIVPWVNISQCQFNSILIDRLLLVDNYPLVFPSKHYVDKLDFVGAMVFDNIPGIHENIAIFDFGSLYPNIIKTANISPDTISATGDVKIGDVRFDSTKFGVMPKLVDKLLARRYKYQKLKLETKDEALKRAYYMLEIKSKTLVNSLYGVYGLPSFRLYNVDVAGSITKFGRHLITSTKNFVELPANTLPKLNLTCSIIAGDTDSIFVRFNESTSNPKRDFKILEELINNNMPAMLKEFTKNQQVLDNHTLEMEYETHFDIMVLADAKKKYIGMTSMFKGKELAEPFFYFRGFELIRKDTPAAMKVSLRELTIKILEDPNDIKTLRTLTTKIYNDVKNSDYRQLLISKQINREPSEYKVVPQHIRAMVYSNEHLGTDFSRLNYKGGMLYIKRIIGRNNLPRTDVIMISPNADLPEGFVIDTEKYYNMFIKNKIELLLPDLTKKIFIKNTLVEWANIGVKHKSLKSLNAEVIEDEAEMIKDDRLMKTQDDIDREKEIELQDRG